MLLQHYKVQPYDCSDINNMRFSSTLLLSISVVILLCLLFSVENLCLKPLINNCPLLSQNTLSYLKYARVVCMCVHTWRQIHSLTNIKGSTHTHAYTQVWHHSDMVNKSFSAEEREFQRSFSIRGREAEDLYLISEMKTGSWTHIHSCAHFLYLNLTVMCFKVVFLQQTFENFKAEKAQALLNNNNDGTVLL